MITNDRHLVLCVDCIITTLTATQLRTRVDDKVNDLQLAETVAAVRRRGALTDGGRLFAANTRRWVDRGTETSALLLRGGCGDGG